MSIERQIKLKILNQVIKKYNVDVIELKQYIYDNTNIDRFIAILAKYIFTYNNNEILLNIIRLYFVSNPIDNFIVFLKKNNSVKKFGCNVSKNMEIKKFLLTHKPLSYFDTAFCWYHTLEGHDYWKELSEKWEKEIKLHKYVLKYDKNLFI
jgi:hypothetical protein